MATISLTIPDAVVPRVLTAFGARLNYLDGQAARDATPAVVKEVLKRYVIEVVRSHEQSIAETAAREGVQLIEVT